MDLEHLIELILPPIIGVLEMMGILWWQCRQCGPCGISGQYLSAPALRAAVRACRRPCHRAGI
ncbi:MAG: hypothetical protein ACLRRT_00710 [Ruthenibacterium lactatiformans]